MACDIVIAVASKVAEYAVAPVGRQLGYVIFYRSNVEDLNTKLQNLEAAKVALQRRADAAKHNGEVIHDHVQAWLVKVDDTVAKANGFQNNEGHARVGCSIRSIPNLWTRHQLSRKATKVMEEISQVLTQGSFDEISYLPHLPVAFPPSARGYEPLLSRTALLNEIMQELKDDNIHMIGVCGMGGVGKSTLVKEVAWQAEHDGFSVQSLWPM
ncbi:hypothetical protein RIF29_30635 [Crotalaria pallida]|uniref:NB-ARC domain-containing protein n=1 Tax=Crotalaria pallida TaxID=3830 RepID=A0AAN9EH47_CROPI